jgi:hypothetical protein
MNSVEPSEYGPLAPKSLVYRYNLKSLPAVCRCTVTSLWGLATSGYRCLDGLLSLSGPETRGVDLNAVAPQATVDTLPTALLSK